MHELGLRGRHGVLDGGDGVCETRDPVSLHAHIQHPRLPTLGSRPHCARHMFWGHIFRDSHEHMHSPVPVLGSCCGRPLPEPRESRDWFHGPKYLPGHLHYRPAHALVVDLADAPQEQDLDHLDVQSWRDVSYSPTHSLTAFVQVFGDLVHLAKLSNRNLGIMCYRLYAAIHSSGEISVDNVTQGIFGFLELWIGVIVACMPTMAPIFVNYILPLASTVHSRLFGSGPSADDSLNMGNMRAVIVDPAVNTFHRSRPEGQKRRKKSLYPEDSTLATSTYAHDGPGTGSEELQVLVVSSPAKAQLQTDCATAQNERPQSQGGIYVQQGFHTQYCSNA